MLDDNSLFCKNSGHNYEIRSLYGSSCMSLITARGKLKTFGDAKYMYSVPAYKLKVIDDLVITSGVETSDSLKT